MPSSGGSESATAPACWLTGLGAGRCSEGVVAALRSDESTFTRRNGPAGLCDGFEDMSAGMFSGVVAAELGRTSSSLARSSNTASRGRWVLGADVPNCSIRPVRRLSVGGGGGAPDSTVEEPVCPGGFLAEPRPSHARGCASSLLVLASTERTPENRRAWRTTGPRIREEKRLIGSWCTAGIHWEQRETSPGVLSPAESSGSPRVAETRHMARSQLTIRHSLPPTCSSRY